MDHVARSAEPNLPDPVPMAPIATPFRDQARVGFFIFFQIAALAAIAWVGWSPVAVGVAGALYLVRMFAITSIYHRYFSHRAYRTNRFWQTVFAVIGCTCMQKGPLWWAAHHRHHHRFSDRPEDVHSPVQHGLWRSHFGWFLSSVHGQADRSLVQDFAAFPELRWLDRHHLLMPVLLAVACFALGVSLQQLGVGTDGPQMLVWGFFLSTTALANATYTINSLAHRWGSRPYRTPDDSRNNSLLALITLGEGWHNNHHRYPAAARQGFRWYQVDLTFYALRALAALRVVRDLRPVPERILAEARPGRSITRAADRLDTRVATEHRYSRH